MTEVQNKYIKEYARSLINNLSLMSGLVLQPSQSQMVEICFILMALHNRRHISLSDSDIKSLILGNRTLNSDPDYSRLRDIVRGLKIKSHDMEV